MNARHSFVAGLALVALATAPAAAQKGRFELVPEVGYKFGGGFDLDPQTIDGVAIPGGKLKLDATAAYGVTAGFQARRGAWFTVSYNYQGTKVGVDWNSPPPSEIGGVTIDPNGKADLTLHQVLFGGRWEFAKSSEQKVVPYLGAGAGFVIVDPSSIAGGSISPSSSTRFLLGLNGGVRYMFGEEKRFGLQGDFKGTWFWLPSGDYYTWCYYWYGCSVYEGTATIAQGNVSVGAVIKF